MVVCVSSWFNSNAQQPFCLKISTPEETNVLMPVGSFLNALGEIAIWLLPLIKDLGIKNAPIVLTKTRKAAIFGLGSSDGKGRGTQNQGSCQFIRKFLCHDVLF